MIKPIIPPSFGEEIYVPIGVGLQCSENLEFFFLDFTVCFCWTSVSPRTDKLGPFQTFTGYFTSFHMNVPW
jgi:hypothetical protein